MSAWGKVFRILRHGPDLIRASCRPGPARADEVHLAAAADWLLKAQAAGGGGGYAHSYDLLRGWQPAYPETTGYIVPSLYRAGERLGRSDLKESAVTAARWLASIQEPDGSFRDLAGRPQAFDTGQILIGLVFLAREVPDDADLGGALAGAAQWLCRAQEADGSFVTFAYNGIPHSYYSRVGAALLAAGEVLGDEAIREAGRKNLRWVVKQQQGNGFFDHLAFDGSAPFLHTMVYVIEGLLDGSAAAGEDSWRRAALAFAEPLLETAARDGILRSQYNPDYSVANRQYCMTGLAQWAGICFRLAPTEPAFAPAGRAALEFCKAHQIFGEDPRTCGGLPGSVPLLGRYMRAAIPNWGVKFFVDALLDAPPAG